MQACHKKYVFHRTIKSNQIKCKTMMRFILLATISIIVLAAKAVEARPSRLFNIYFLEQGPYMNPKWCGDVVFEAQEEGVETPPEPTGGGRRRRRGERFLGEKKVQTVSIMTKPQVQRGERGDKSKTKKSRAGEFTLLRRTRCIVGDSISRYHTLPVQQGVRFSPVPLCLLLVPDKPKRHGWFGMDPITSIDDIYDFD
jgi:hypothetical protein